MKKAFSSTRQYSESRGATAFGRNAVVALL